MKAFRSLSATLLSLGFSAGLTALPALAFPEISSGDGIVNADISTCLDRTDAFVDTLNVSVERGDIVRTGYFGDGSFRILCYPNPYSYFGKQTDQQANQSMVVIFAAHESDLDVADTFVQIALSKIADPQMVAP